VVRYRPVAALPAVNFGAPGNRAFAPVVQPLAQIPADALHIERGRTRLELETGLALSCIEQPCVARTIFFRGAGSAAAHRIIASDAVRCVVGNGVSTAGPKPDPDSPTPKTESNRCAPARLVRRPKNGLPQLTGDASFVLPNANREFPAARTRIKDVRWQKDVRPHDLGAYSTWNGRRSDWIGNDQ
jgi:hypothetical protein